MSVLTKLLLLLTSLSTLADSAPNKKNDKKNQSLSHLRSRDIATSSTQNTCHQSLTASGSSFGSRGVVPYPTEGAPFQNYTSLSINNGNEKGESDKNGSVTQCPPQQTVTLPPQTITLPAQTVTMIPTPETITVTQTQIETVTVTVAPQTQTTTVTIWMTVTANQTSSCPTPGNAANPQIAPMPGPNPQPTPFMPVFDHLSTPVIKSPILTTPNLVVPLSTDARVPIANDTSPLIPTLSPIIATGPVIFPANSQTSPVFQQTSSFLVAPLITSPPIIAPYLYRNASNQTFPIGSGSSRGFRPTRSGSAKPTNRHFPSHLVYKTVTDTPISTTRVGPSPTKEHFLANGSSLLIPPLQANATVQSAVGPTAPPSPTIEYFPDDGSSLLKPPNLANATSSAMGKYVPGNGSSLLTPPAQANASSTPPMDGPEPQIITPAVGGSSQNLTVVMGSATPPIIPLNTTTSITPISTPIPPPIPPTIQTNTSASPLSSTPNLQIPQQPTTNTPPVCTNGTTAQNITTDVRPFSFPTPFPSPAQPH